MKNVTDIELVDGEYCFCLRYGNEDLVLFAFRTEKEAQIAADALSQIAEHAVAILPAAKADHSQESSETEATEPEQEPARAIAAADTDDTRREATSPFLGR